MAPKTDDLQPEKFHNSREHVSPLPARISRIQRTHFGRNTGGLARKDDRKKKKVGTSATLTHANVLLFTVNSLPPYEDLMRSGQSSSPPDR